MVAVKAQFAVKFALLCIFSVRRSYVCVFALRKPCEGPTCYLPCVHIVWAASAAGTNCPCWQCQENSWAWRPPFAIASCSRIWCTLEANVHTDLLMPYLDHGRGFGPSLAVLVFFKDNIQKSFRVFEGKGELARICSMCDLLRLLSHCICLSPHP